MKCPVCKRRDYPEPCEQTIAIKKRGMCIACLVERDESIEIEPYEFAVPKAADGQAVAE